MKYLVGSPQAVEFLDSVRLDSTLKVLLGDGDTVEPLVRPDFLSARMELRQAVLKLEGLAQDPTRTEVQRHSAAKKLADAVEEKLGKAKAAIERRADELWDGAIREADRGFAPKADRGMLESECRDWVFDQSRKSDGLQRIRKEMAESADLAAVIWHSPRFLTGLPKETHENLRFEALKIRQPELYAATGASLDLRKTAEKFSAVIRKVQTAFYSPVLASQASKRVEV